MILIFSSTMDSSTNKVISWIKSMGKEVVRVNNADFLAFVYSMSFTNRESTEIKFQFNNLTFSEQEIEAVWFRRHSYSYTFEKQDFYFTDSSGNNNSIDELNQEIIGKNIKSEFKVVRDYVFYRLQKRPIVLGHWKENNENKLQILDLALEVGLKIPKSIVVRGLKSLNLQIQTKKIKQVITKSLSYSPGLVLGQIGRPISSFTSVVDAPLAKNSHEASFLWSLFQEKIDKSVEIRTFFLNGSFFSMAIFSQTNRQTSVDFRVYDTKKPNRTVPYQLPNSVEKKLRRLLDKLLLNTASIDLLLTNDGAYVFLEVNPVGQFGMVSRPCNYFLEKRIAAYLAGIEL